MDYKKILQVLEKEVGYVEGKNNDNKYGKAYGWNNVPYCVIFMWWAFKEAGASEYFCGGTKQASCTKVKEWAQAHNCWVTKNYQIGDIVIFQWKNGSRHCGIVQSVCGNKLKTVEGNTAVGNDSNGGEVMLRNRTTEFVLGAVRPTFEQEVVNVDYEQFIKLLNEYRNELRDNDSNSYSEEARNWATSIGLIQGNGTTPDGQPNYMWADFLTREQFITVLYRFAKKLGVR